jgi:hypothetical protein
MGSRLNADARKKFLYDTTFAVKPLTLLHDSGGVWAGSNPPDRTDADQLRRGSTPL